ncbi:permease-like cell division protein FtsX [Salibacter sp.]|uniref:cell division protein FtsX n=1 Tax=Salibacter sp. TaxID=2010995 RepID=UPI002870AC9C|nr:permease-like cell division protein FtsX [Salibacter sp.]MDR9399163.1 permease-like cell division protein FtsX [Salibacter sp.]MDR9488392.1 permease-like cell division protein FtsX [Salibacter sp.]
MSNKFERRRLNTSYFSVVVSISLVLFMLGMVGLILLQANKLSNYVKENIGISIYIKDDVNQADIKRLQKSLDASKYVKYTDYVDKQEAATRLQEDLGEDFIDFLGYNPLSTSIDVYLKAEFANPDSVQMIEQSWLDNPKVKEVEYQKNLLSIVNENVRKISLLLSGFAILLMIIAVALINSTIRLAIYSKRFLIRSMQLVGATQSFIRKPFVNQGILHGLYGALIALVLLAGVIYYAQSEMPEIFDMQDVETFAVLFVIVVLLGMLISWLSTTFAVNRYLKLKTDQLYMR